MQDSKTKAGHTRLGLDDAAVDRERARIATASSTATAARERRRGRRRWCRCWRRVRSAGGLLLALAAFAVDARALRRRRCWRQGGREGLVLRELGFARRGRSSGCGIGHGRVVGGPAGRGGGRRSAGRGSGGVGGAKEGHSRASGHGGRVRGVSVHEGESGGWSGRGERSGERGRGRVRVSAVHGHEAGRGLQCCCCVVIVLVLLLHGRAEVLHGGRCWHCHGRRW